MREFERSVDLFILVSFEVVLNPLQVDDEHIWSLSNERPLRKIDCLVASITLEVTYDFSFYLLLKRFVD